MEKQYHKELGLFGFAYPAAGFYLSFFLSLFSLCLIVYANSRFQPENPEYPESKSWNIYRKS